MHLIFSSSWQKHLFMRIVNVVEGLSFIITKAVTRAAAMMKTMTMTMTDEHGAGGRQELTVPVCSRQTWPVLNIPEI